MLQHLSIKNYAIIDSLEINFSKQMNIITGETGAGKSILLGALSLILGDRAETGMLRDKHEKCVIEAHFDLTNIELSELFLAEELDFSKDTIIRREILPNGKSRAFVNDTPATLKALKEITSHLVDLHSQHETLEIGENDYQLFVVDAVADNANIFKHYKNLYHQRQALLSQLKKLEEKQIQAHKEADYVRFQLLELNEVALEEIDQVSLEADLKTLNHAEEIKSKLVAAMQVLGEEEASVLTQLHQTIATLRPIKDINQNLSQLHERIESCLIELSDIEKEIGRLEGNTFFDASKMDEINTALSVLYKLQKKHGALDIHDLMGIRDSLAKQSLSFDSVEKDIEKTNNDIVKLEIELTKKGDELAKSRSAVFKQIESQVMITLQKVGMPDATFLIEQNKLDKNIFSLHGTDSIQFLFCANKGGTLKEIRKVASGGELSRLMLSIKSILAASVALPTMIFDEIDTGISGNIAAKTAEVLNEMGDRHQLICITHLPQIAARGQKHFHIFKNSSSNQTFANVKELNKEERLHEIAAMLAGDNITEGALRNAKELLATP
jgi:DNA repair protein RecN (Recombination protein N)